jgi:hypothetical protein
MARSDGEKLCEYFKARNWEFRGPEWVQSGVESLAEKGYENDIATMTAKILRHGKAE